MTVIPFRRPNTPPPANEHLFTIDIYRGDGNGFHWVVIAPDADRQPDVEELSGYLADMFIALNPQPPGILERLQTFFANLTRKTGAK